MLHAAQRTGFILDDWFALRGARFGGAWNAGVIQQASRPGEWVTYAATFGLFGRHPLPYVVVLGAIEVLTAVALVLLVRLFLPEVVGVVVASLWVLLPDHVTLEVWASATNIGLAVLLLIVGLYLAVRHGGTLLGILTGGVALGAAVLCYEAVGPVALVGGIALPWVAERRIEPRRAAIQTAAVGGAGLWIVLHWNRNKPIGHGVSAIGQVVPAQLGWGIAPQGTWATLVLVAAVVGSCLVIAAPGMRTLARRVPELRWALASGWLVLLLGVLPFLKYAYGPVGAGDRANCVSALGGALIWAVLLWALWETLAHAERRIRVIAVGVAVVLLVGGALEVRWQSSRRWARAFGDADRILAAAVREIPDPTGPIALGPRPIQERNVAAFLDDSNVNGALQVAYGRRDVTGVITYFEHDFKLFPVRYRVDIRPLSKLKPDAVLQPSM